MAKAPPPKFDQARLQQMSEPFTVRVERMKGNSKSQIPLPPKEGFGVGGPGWTMEEILGLEQWIIKEWSGGGTYLFQVTDSSSSPQTMEWTAVFPYPERVPPIMADAMASVPPVVQSVGSPAQHAPSPPAAAPWPPPAQQWAGMGPVPQAPPPMQPSGWNIPAPSPWGWGGPFNFAPPAPATPIKNAGSETDQLKAELERLRLAQLEERHRAEVQQREAAHAQQMAAMQEQLRQLKEGLTARPSGESEEVKAMKLQMEREREERQRAEREAAAERHRSELAALEAKIAAATTAKPSSEVEVLKAQIEADRRQREEERRFEQLQRNQEQQLAAMREELRAAREAAAANRGPDPMLMMIVDVLKQNSEATKEITRQQVEAQKEVARQHAESIRDIKSQVVHPGEMFRMLREASSGQDQIISSVTRTLNDVFTTSQQWFNQMVQSMGGGGEHPAVRLIEGGMAQAKEMAERYFSTKAQAQVAGANAQREHAKAMQVQAQAQAQAVAIQAGVYQPPQQVAAPAAPAAPPAQTSAPLNGAASVDNDAPPAPREPLRKGGKTDSEWFGPAIDDVNAMRKVAAEFCASVQAGRLDAKGIPVGLGPDQAAGFIIQAANVIQKQGVKGVYAFDYLFNQGMYADLVDVLLPGPDVVPEYRADVVRFIDRILAGGSPDDDDGDDDDDEDDGEGDDTPANGAAAHA